MDDFGNIIYVLIAVGWFLFNAYKKSQQKKVVQPKNTGPSHEYSEPVKDTPKSFEDMIMEQLRGVAEKESARPEPVPVVKNEDKFLNTDRTHMHLDDSYKMSRSEMGGHRIERQVRRLDVVEEEEERSIDRILPEGFDLRQAVVMSVILDRPYK